MQKTAECIFWDNARFLGSGVLFKKGRLKVPMPVLHSCAHLREGPSEVIIKKGRGSGSDLATHKHNVLTVLAATAAGNAFLTSGRHAPLLVVSLHFAALSAPFSPVSS